MPTAPNPPAVLDRHATLTGTVTGHDLVVHGTLDGDLRLTGCLHVAAGGRVRARVQASRVDLEGEFDGELRAEMLRVTATAHAQGVFRAERLCIEEGAVLEGSVQAPVGPEAVPVAPSAAATAVPNGHATGDALDVEDAAEPDPEPAPVAAPPA
jgi:cytoskeletal protein CcmA (bactofilin family)